MYYGWTIQGDKLFCREAYASTPPPSRPTSTTSCRPSARCSSRARRRWTRSTSWPEGGLADIQEERRRPAIYWDRCASFSKFKMRALSHCAV